MAFLAVGAPCLAGEPHSGETRVVPRVSAHFRLQTVGPRRSDRLERETVAALESWYRHFQITFEIEPPTPIPVFLFPQHLFFHHSTGAPPWADGIFDQEAGIRIATGGISRLEPDLERVLGHELAHAFIACRSAGHAPRWLHEGLAQMLARSTGLGHQSAESSAPAAGTLETLDYSGSLAFVQDLAAAHGLEALIDVLAAQGRGLCVDDAFRLVTGASAAELFRDWSARSRAALAADKGE
jgi:hypothetical protein